MRGHPEPSPHLDPRPSSQRQLSPQPGQVACSKQESILSFPQSCWPPGCPCIPTSPPPTPAHHLPHIYLSPTLCPWEDGKWYVGSTGVSGSLGGLALGTSTFGGEAAFAPSERQSGWPGPEDTPSSFSSEDLLVGPQAGRTKGDTMAPHLSALSGLAAPMAPAPHCLGCVRGTVKGLGSTPPRRDPMHRRDR